MKKALLRSLVLALGVALVSSAAYAKKSTDGYGSYSKTATWSDVAGLDNPNSLVNKGGLNASAAANTLFLYAGGPTSSRTGFVFQSGANCVTEGWTTHDITQQTGDYWHVDDFAASNALGTLGPSPKSTGGIVFNRIQGSKSLWMAKRIPPGPGVDTIHCGYLALPGYGNSWNQAFCTKNCVALGGNGLLDIAMKIKYDSEPSYDGTFLEYTTDCAGNLGWTSFEGGVPEWTGADSLSVAAGYNIGVAGPVKVRIRFAADTSWSNQDGLYAGFGVAVDSLSAETLAVEDFEGEAVGANSANDWQSCNTPGYGNFLALFKRSVGAGNCGIPANPQYFANYEDQCLDNLGCYWAAICGSTEFYTCGNPPQNTQRIVPHKNVRNEYISNEIWSPVLPLAGSAGSDFRLRYTVYNDLELANLIFHVWHVRTIDTSSCPSSWQDRNFVYYSNNKAWTVTENAIGSKINVATGASIQVAIGVLDMCPFWCGVFGDGVCHSPSPYIDNVKVLRIDTIGPQWDVRDIDTFQDNFASNGTTTGTARFDEAIDTRSSDVLTYEPGDSGVALFLVDPKYVSGAGTNSSGLSADLANISTFVGRHKTKKQVYIYVAVWPLGQPGKTGAALAGTAKSATNPGGTDIGGVSTRYFFAGTTVANGVTWSKIRFDYTYTGNPTNPNDGNSATTDPYVANRFNVDLNDNLFQPCDTICYFYGATSLDGTTYYSAAYGSTTDINAVAANPMEVTILPAGGWKRGGDILYVDGADGFGVQNYYDGAFQVLGLEDKIDRYDVRGPSSGVSNRLGGRVINVQNQLNDCYQKIVWDSGALAITLGDGLGDPEKTDDYATMVTFLGNLTNPGGVFLLGDKQGEYLNGYAGSNAVAFRSLYMNFTLISDNHRLTPTFLPISPKVFAWPGRCYTDNFNLFGGCPTLNDFDVLGAVSPNSQVEMSYNAASSANGAVISQVNGNARVLMAGFSLLYTRDDELDGIDDQAKFLRDSFFWMGNPLGPVTGAGPGLKNDLSQNYPNPFNPQTTIAFSLKDRGQVSLKVYNVNGELVRTLANENRAAGPHQLTWDGRNDSGQPVSSGVYFYKLVANNFAQTKKMVLLK
jgi:hypothetical protein